MCVYAYAYVYIEVLAQVYIFTLLKKSDVCLLGQPRLYSPTDKVVNKASDFTIAVRNPIDLLWPWCLVIAVWWKNVKAVAL